MPRSNKGRVARHAGVQAMAKRMGHNVVGHHPIMPGVSKAAKAFAATRCLEDSLHVPMMTILLFLCKTLTPADAPRPRHPVGSSIGSDMSLRNGRFRFPIG